jgi:hypothetical protein
VSYKTTIKAISIYRNEAKAEEKKLRAPLDNSLDNESEKSINSEEADEVELKNLSVANSWLNSVVIFDHDSFHTKTLKKIKAGERTHFHKTKTLLTVSSLLVLIMISLIRSNIFDDFLIHITPYSILDIILCTLFMASCVILLFCSIKIIKTEYKLK